jgi:lipid-A-disaccharide synthase
MTIFSPRPSWTTLPPAPILAAAARAMPKRVFITVGEVSGDRHAAELTRALTELDPTIIVEGHGGSAMRDAGVIVHHETVHRAAMLLKAVARAAEVYRLLLWTRDYYARNKTDLHVCIDSSGMNLHFAKMARAAGVPVLYYIAPQLWASRPGRIKKVRRYVNRVACILPFEEAYYRERGVDATFVGHPLFDELPADRRLSLEPRGFGESTGGQAASGTADRGSAPVIGLMPGSRRAEVRANLPHMLEVADRIRAAFRGARFEIPTTPPTHQLVGEFTGGRPDLRIAQDAIDAMAPHWDICLAKSGTTTLHVAAYGVPMVVVFRASRLAWQAVRWLITTPSIALVNILAERAPAATGVPKRRIVPEIIPWHGSNRPVADLCIDLLRDVEKRREQRANLLKLVASIDRPGASDHCARLIREMIG